MKKTMMIAALFAASTLAASAADVYSSNIVGYNKITINPGYNMISASFVNVGDGSAQAMNDLFPEAEAKAVAGVGSDLADNIMMWNGSQYVTYYFYYGNYGPDYDYKWYDASDDAEPTLELVDPKDGFWYRSRTNETYTTIVKGQVSTNSSVSITLNPGYNMIANPYPVALPLNGLLDWNTIGSVSGVGSDLADNIMAWVNGQYVTYYFYYGNYGPDYDYKWYDASDDAEPTTYEIPVGSGVWYRYRGVSPITVTIDNPIN